MYIRSQSIAKHGQKDQNVYMWLVAELQMNLVPYAWYRMHLLNPLVMKDVLMTLIHREGKDCGESFSLLDKVLL